LPRIDNRFGAAEAIGQALVKRGLSKTALPSTFTKEEVDKYFEGVRGQPVHITSGMKLTSVGCGIV
jgi:hypothetical protein